MNLEKKKLLAATFLSGLVFYALFRLTIYFPSLSMVVSLLYYAVLLYGIFIVLRLLFSLGNKPKPSRRRLADYVAVGLLLAVILSGTAQLLMGMVLTRDLPTIAPMIQPPPAAQRPVCGYALPACFGFSLFERWCIGVLEYMPVDCL